MEKLFTNLKYAAKNVFYHAREFLVFFIAVFVVQVFFGVVSLSYFNNNSIDFAHASDGYDYHLELRNLNSDQYYFFMNNEEYSNRRDDAIYDIIKIVERNKNSINNRRYDVYIRLFEDTTENLDLFESRYLKGFELNGDGNYSVEYTPLMLYEKSLFTNKVVYIAVLILMFLVAFFLMLLLFSYRLNHFKFTYGIYLTFGANFKKLFSSSVWEMLFVTLATFIPACIASVVFTAVIYSGAEVGVSINFGAFVIMLLFSLAVSALAVWTPIKLLAYTSPVKALSAEDNSNYVSSPKTSNRLISFRYPVGYVLNSMFRYRKYILKLIFSGVLFSMAYIGAAYFADLYDSALSYNAPSYSIDFSAGSDVYEDGMYDDLVAIDGVKDVVKTEQISAATASSHMLLSASDVTYMSGALVTNVNGERVAVTNNLSYRPLDLGIAKYLSENYEHDGDILASVGKENTIVVCQRRFNKTALKLEVGDTVRIATFLSADKVPETYETGKKYLQQQLDYNSYSYRTFTVGAVIYDMPAGTDTPLYLPCIDYTLLSRRSSDYTLAQVYLEENLSMEETRAAGDKLRSFAFGYDSVEVNEILYNDKEQELEKNYALFTRILAYLILIISPVVWMFAQVLFYLKREGEFLVLETFGTVERELCGIYLGEGTIIMLISVAVYTLVALIVTWVINMIANLMYVNPGFDYSLPVVPYIVGLAVTGISSFGSALIPYLVYRKKKLDLVRSASSGERV